MKIDKIYENSSGITAEGVISQGTIKAGDEVTIVHDPNYHTVAQIQYVTYRGDCTALTFGGVDSESVHVGDYIIKE